MKKPPNVPLPLATLVLALALSIPLTSSPLSAQAEAVSDKIQLMAEILRARDAGDLDTSRAKAEELIRIAPEDEDVQRLLVSLNEEMERRERGEGIYGRAAGFDVEDTLEADAARLKQSGAVEEADAPVEEAVDEPGKQLELKASDDASTSGSLELIPETVEDPDEASPDAAPTLGANGPVRDLMNRGRAQYLAGDLDAAAATFRAVEARDAGNAEAKQYLTEIAGLLGEVHARNRRKTREQMLMEVAQGWDRPKVFDLERSLAGPAEEGGRTLRKLNAIRIPQVSFSGMELARVIETLSELSLEYDPEREGVNIVPLFNPNEINPKVNIRLRNLSLDRILAFVTQQVNFAYDVGPEAVTVAPSDAAGGNASMVTEFFPVTRATVVRLTGFRDAGASPAPSDPFAPPVRDRDPEGRGDETGALRSFFRNAGVNFDLPGAGMAFDGEQLIVTQTTRNLERVRAILRNYNEVKQVEIEAKFLEVNQSDLEEIGFSWLIESGDGQEVFLFEPTSLSDAFDAGASGSTVAVNPAIPGFAGGVPSPAPATPRTIDLGSDVLTDVFTANGWSIGSYDVDVAIRALSRKAESDLMSAPKVTVLSGKRATITVAQELRYPESYGDIESTVSSGSDGGGNAAVSITAGTPQDFVTRKVGVEMSVTPNVENDDTISLILEPRVTEFEGFVEYGGPSIALSGSTSAVVPAGFYQPVFSTRELTTEVTIFDGATVVMGGLTREEVKAVHDKVPLLGDIPGIGRLFRSEGESSLKRSLLIFVTANLVSPGGSPARQRYRSVQPNSLYQNPVIQTPGGTVNRGIAGSG